MKPTLAVDGLDVCLEDIYVIMHGGTSLPDHIRNILVENARTMMLLKKRKRRIKQPDEKIEGEIFTTWKLSMFGNHIGFEFHAEIDFAGGSTGIKFIARYVRRELLAELREQSVWMRLNQPLYERLMHSMEPGAN